MKKTLCTGLVFLIALCLPLCALADAAAPAFQPYEAYAGIGGIPVSYDLFDENGDATPVEETLPFGTRVTLIDWGVIQFQNESGSHISEVPVIILNETFPADEDVSPYDVDADRITPAAYTVSAYQTILRRGPNTPFDAKRIVKQGETLTIKALYGSWGYLQTLTESGWVDLEDLEFLSADAPEPDPEPEPGPGRDPSDLLFPVVRAKGLPLLALCVGGALILSATCVVTVLLIHRAKKRRDPKEK